MTSQVQPISSTFIWRRVHSLMGFWLVLYLIVHLITNSQAALWIGDDGSGFIRLVNTLESLPFLQVVETVLIGIPLLIHGVWGIKRALSAKCNSAGKGEDSPSLKYSRNRAFTWQRLSSWILLFGILGHVAQMRFLDAPKKAKTSAGERYFTKLNFDEGLYTLTPRLGVCLVTAEELRDIQEQLKSANPIEMHRPGSSKIFDAKKEEHRELLQEAWEERESMKALASYRLKDTQVIAISPVPGTAFLLMVRDTFKSPLMAVLYTIFLLAAAFHAFNGFWTFLITWGVILSYRSQKAMLPVSWVGAIILSVLGLAAIWCSYFVNLRY